MVELPKTEQELNDLIDAKISEVTAKLEAKHNSDMATMRQRHDAELKKTREQANLSAEELAQEKIKEQQQADFEELQTLRAYKKSNEISERLAKEGLPSYFKNDTRLLNADDGNLDKAIKDVKKEYEATLPKGATHSTVVQSVSGQRPTNSDESKQQLFEDVGNALKDALGQ